MNKELDNLTKAETLENLLKLKSSIKFEIPKNIFFRKKELINDSKRILDLIKKNFNSSKLIIRSSSINEDTNLFTNAGKYNSYVCQKNSILKIKEKLTKISNELENYDDQIIVQEYIENVNYSGVCFTREINSNAPYFCFSIDYSGKTNSVTAGLNSKLIKNYYIFKYKSKYFGKFKNLIKLFMFFEKKYKENCLDIEFAVKNRKIYIFQCRKILLSQNKTEENIFIKELTKIEKKIKNSQKRNTKVLGSTTYFSKMSDWNPVEILGEKASQLSLSLYSQLITNEIWARQRSNYGYDDLRGNKLMFDFCNTPFIDLRVDLNSFLLKSFTKKIKKKLIISYLKKIKNNSNLHDKIEFKIVKSCYDFNNNFDKNFSNHEKLIIKSNLINFTNTIILGKYLEKDISKADDLKENLRLIKSKKISELRKIKLLISKCKSNGTLPFAGIARCAFIGTSIINALLHKKLLNLDEYNNFFNSITTISNEINEDYQNTIISKKNKNIFINKYGHLRPSTYSISSLNYKEGFNNYFSGKKFSNKNKFIKKFKLSQLKKNKINNYFKKNKLNFNCDQFFNFLNLSITQREKSKFEFTKYINEIFLNLIKFGIKNNITREDLEHININKIIKYKNMPKKLKLDIKNIKQLNTIKNKIIFPDLIKNYKDIYFFEQEHQSGNFVTLGEITGSPLYLSNQINIDKINNKINNKIILIDNADPGYDFLFSYNIKGLITKYGGPNSHMAIRCLEWKIPSVIGVGDKIFNNIINKNSIYINCKLKLIETID